MTEHRCDRLQRLINDRFDGVQSDAAKALFISTGYLNDLLRGRVSFGEKVARRIEAAAVLPPGWLDKQRGGADAGETLEVVINGKVVATAPAGSAVMLRTRKG